MLEVANPAIRADRAGLGPNSAKSAAALAAEKRVKSSARSGRR